MLHNDKFHFETPIGAIGIDCKETADAKKQANEITHGMNGVLSVRTKYGLRSVAVFHDGKWTKA